MMGSKRKNTAHDFHVNMVAGAEPKPVAISTPLRFRLGEQAFEFLGRFLPSAIDFLGHGAHVRANTLRLLFFRGFGFLFAEHH